MKISQKVKKFFVLMGTFFATLTSKVFAVQITDILYGPPKPNPEPKSLILKNIFNICKIALIPIVLIIGIQIYLKKSKSNKKRKIITILITLALVVLLYFILNYFMK